MRDIREYVKKHGDDATDYDIDNWEKITSLKYEIAKSSLSKKSLLARVREALDCGDLQRASDLQLDLQAKMSMLRNLYSTYRKNLL